MRIGVLADDLTGAGDAALAFERAGFRAEVALWPPGPPPRSGVLWVISTESRGLSPAAARARARRAGFLLKRWKAAFIFKKIDSTLRGPIAEELKGLEDALGPWKEPLPFVPAFPAQGRTTRDGGHFVDGKPLHRTAFARDPQHPVRTNVVADLAGVSGLWIPDVWDGASLRRAAVRAAGSRDGVAVGSGGFAGAVARFLPGARTARRKASRAKTERRFSARSFPVLLVSGSAHPISHRQADAVRGFPALSILRAPAARGNPRAVLSRLVRRAKSLVGCSGVRCFAVTGGETAAALARALKTRRWRILEEAGRGMPLMASIGGTSRTRWLIKPGGFGREDAWTRAIKRLSGRS